MAFQLEWETPVEWVDLIAPHTLELLGDHAHAELRAAASAQALISKRPQSKQLVEALGKVALEESEHFNQVIDLLHKRGGQLERAQNNPYAAGLLSGWSSKQGEVLLDRLLISALIEARSLERFVLLARHLPDEELSAFYESLIASESGHRALFVTLARESYPEKRVAERLAEFISLEASVMSRLPFSARMHSGLAETNATV